MFNKLFKATVGQITDSMKKFANQEFLEATLAACALVTAADGKIEAAEKEKTLGAIQNTEELKLFDTSVVAKIFNQHLGKLEFDFDMGLSDLIKVIKKGVDGDYEKAERIVVISAIIAKSDDTIDGKEKDVIIRIAKELSVDIKKLSINSYMKL